MQAGSCVKVAPPNYLLAGPRAATWLVMGFCTILTTIVNAQTQTLTFQSREEQTSLLELFTSEGCSSCPPAEKWLSDLKTAPGLWKQFVPVAFHVDYWDYLGWRDPWASKAFSDRQRSYARLWRGDSIYTPGFVLNGQEWRGGSQPKDGPPASSRKVGILKVSSADVEHWQVSFLPSTKVAADFEVHAALLVSGLISDVKAGENRGRRLSHDFIVTSLTNGSLKRDGDKFVGELIVEPIKKGQSNRLALAAWVTRPGSLEPLQAVGGWL